MSVRAIDLRRGQAFVYKGNVHVCESNEKVAKGKGQSYQVVEFRNAKTGQLFKERFRTTEEFEDAFIDRKEMEYLYSTGTAHVVMDPESYEQVELPAELIGEKSVYLQPNCTLNVSFVDGETAAVDLPATVELTVTDTPPEIKGATATNQLKDAACEGGARVKVPPFVVNGTKIKVDTRSGEYISRA